jgi:hypothetical protein
LFASLKAFFEIYTNILRAAFCKFPGVNFTNPLAQSANAPVVILWCQWALFSFTNKITSIQLHHYIQLENTLNFYPVHPALCANKFSVNLLAAFMSVECW